MLQPVAPQELASVWEFVRGGLLKTIAKTNDDWLPEDVYVEIKGGVSFLYLIFARGERIGFVVLQKWDKYHAGPRLFVRALWAEPRKLLPYHDDFYEALHDLARKAGCVAMRMTSPRRWELDGWTPKQSIYEMEVRTL